MQYIFKKIYILCYFLVTAIVILKKKKMLNFSSKLNIRKQ